MCIDDIIFNYHVITGIRRKIVIIFTNTFYSVIIFYLLFFLLQL